jgi:hypothetical protein
MLLRRRKGMPFVVRILPVMEVLMLGAALACHHMLFTAVSALILIAHTAAIYKVRTHA